MIFWYFDYLYKYLLYIKYFLQISSLLLIDILCFMNTKKLKNCKIWYEKHIKALIFIYDIIIITFNYREKYIYSKIINPTTPAVWNLKFWICFMLKKFRTFLIKLNNFFKEYHFPLNLSTSILTSPHIHLKQFTKSPKKRSLFTK